MACYTSVAPHVVVPVGTNWGLHYGFHVAASRAIGQAQALAVTLLGRFPPKLDVVAQKHADQSSNASGNAARALASFKTRSAS